MDRTCDLSLISAGVEVECTIIIVLRTVVLSRSASCFRIVGAFAQPIARTTEARAPPIKRPIMTWRFTFDQSQHVGMVVHQYGSPSVTKLFTPPIKSIIGTYR